MNASIWAAVGLSISLAAAPAIAGATPPRPRATITDIIERSGGQFDQNGNDFDVLLTALGAAGLTSALDDPTGNLTLFAPTDAAFIATAQDLGFSGTNEGDAWQFLVTTLTTLGGGDPIPTLTNILLYHVAPQRLNSQLIRRREVLNQTIPTLLSGATITPFNGTLIDNDPDYADPVRIAPRDVRAANGLIQRINRVLLPINVTPPPPPTPVDGTITGIVSASGGTFDQDASDFDILLTAVVAADLAGALGNPDAHLTVFAPTDAAFIATARDLGFTGTDEAGAWAFLVDTFTTLGGGDPIEPLTDVLLYHVLPFEADTFILSILDWFDIDVPTLLADATLKFRGQQIIDFADGIQNPRRLTPEPVNATNGNIFPIDRVLLPLDL